MIPDYPDYIWRDPDGYILYFGVPDGNVSLLPVGAVFDMLWTNTWNKVRWVAVEGVVKYGKNKGEWGRWYCVQQERYLDADECGVWQDYLEQWEMELV